LINALRNRDHRVILDSTHGIFFFGTPHGGLEAGGLQEILEGRSDGEKANLLRLLKEGSYFLNNQKEDLLCVWKVFKPKVVSFYETHDTSTAEEVCSPALDFEPMTADPSKHESGKIERSGPKVHMVHKSSAQLFLPTGCETRLPIDANHTDMVKFDAKTDTTYQTVVTHLEDWIGM